MPRQRVLLAPAPNGFRRFRLASMTAAALRVCRRNDSEVDCKSTGTDLPRRQTQGSGEFPVIARTITSNIWRRIPAATAGWAAVECPLNLQSYKWMRRRRATRLRFGYIRSKRETPVTGRKLQMTAARPPAD